MESVLHDIEELQRMASDLATSSHSYSPDKVEEDLDLFLTRIENFITDNHIANSDYISAKLGLVRSSFGYLLREAHLPTDPERHRLLAHNNLNLVYRLIRNPVLTEPNPNDE